MLIGQHWSHDPAWLLGCWETWGSTQKVMSLCTRKQESNRHRNQNQRWRLPPWLLLVPE